MAPSSEGGPTGKGGPGSDSGESDSDTGNNDTSNASDKVLGKRRARTPQPESIPEAQEEEESLSDADADWEPEFELEASTTASTGSAPKFARLTSEPRDDSSQQGSPQPGPSTTRGARGITVRRRALRNRTPGSLVDYESLPNEAPHFICDWRPLQRPNDPPCLESCTRLSDLRRHQRPHFELDLEYAKEHRPDAVAAAQAKLDSCAGRGQAYACEFCGKVYSRLDAVARHRQQPQGKQCNVAYKKKRTEERNRAKENQEVAEPESDKEMDKAKEMDKEME